MLDRKIAPADAPHRLDGFEHGMAVAGTTIQCHRGTAATQVRQRRAIGLRKVADVNEIPDAASVRGRVIGSEYIDLGALPCCHLDRDLQKMGRAHGRKSKAAL